VQPTPPDFDNVAALVVFIAVIYVICLLINLMCEADADTDNANNERGE